MKSVLKDYNKPYNFKIYTEKEKDGSYKSDRVIASLYYRSKTESKVLLFLRQENGEFAYIGLAEE